MELREDSPEEARKGTLGLESGAAFTIAHFAVRPWVSHPLSRISVLLLKTWSSKKMISKVLSIVETIAPFIKCLVQAKSFIHKHSHHHLARFSFPF